jgi:hypothetical protein
MRNTYLPWVNWKTRFLAAGHPCSASSRPTLASAMAAWRRTAGFPSRTSCSSRVRALRVTSSSSSQSSNVFSRIRRSSAYKRPGEKKILGIRLPASLSMLWQRSRVQIPVVSRSFCDKLHLLTSHGCLYNVFGTYPIKPKPTHVNRCI